MGNSDFSYSGRVLPPGDILYLGLKGRMSPATTRRSVPRVREALVRRGLRALVLDYSRVNFLHNEVQFDHVTGRLAHLLPRNLVTAVVYSSASKPHAIMLTRALQASGLLVGAFADRRDAITWTRRVLTLRDTTDIALARSA